MLHGFALRWSCAVHHTGIALTARIVYSLITASLVGACSLSPTPARALNVTVQRQLTGGAQPAGTAGAAVVPHTVGPAGADVLVQVLSRSTPDTVLAEGKTDSQGHVQFQLPDGTYWLVVPWGQASL